MSNSVRRSGPQRKRRGVVSSSVVAVATAGVTGITLAWAIGTSPTPDGSAEAAAKVSSQIKADRAAMTQLQQAIADTRGQLSALGGVSLPASPQNSDASAGTPGPTVVTAGSGTTATIGPSGGAVTSAGVTHSGASGNTTSSTGSAGASSGAPAGAASGSPSGATSGGSSGGAPAPAPAPAPTPAPTAPPATSPPPTKPPPPPVTTTTRASAA